MGIMSIFGGTPPLGVADEELRPNAAHVRLILAAACDIRICEKTLDTWKTEFDKRAGYAGTRFSSLVGRLMTMIVTVP